MKSITMEMKKMKLLFLGVISLTTGCGQNIAQVKSSDMHDPIDFASSVHAVCRIGERGGDGTLISPQWVLTAAHVALGMYDRSGGDLIIYFDDGNTRKAEFIYSHPEFESETPADIALIYFSEPILQIKPVEIYRHTDETGKEIMLAGHGDKHNEDGSWIRDGKLRAYTNTIDSTNKTWIMFDYDAPGVDCIISEGTSGPGDSGGPAFIIQDGVMKVAGISSMGDPGKNGPATIGAHEYFTRVSSYTSWIDLVMQDPNTSTANKINVFAKENLQSTPAELPQSAKAIIEALEHFTEEKMIDAIAKGYDESVLKLRDPKQIMQNMPFLIKELQLATLIGVVNQSTEKLTVQMKKGNNLYMLEFFLTPSQKIEQMAFGRTG